MKQTLKSWATPFAVGAFTISTVTGLLIFFDIEIGLVEPAHKWLSWLLVTAVLLHLISNGKQFVTYFSKKTALGIIGAALIITVASLLPIFGEEDEGKKKGIDHQGKIAVQLLESSSLETVALVTRITQQHLVEELGKSGIIVKNPSLTIQQIASTNKKSEKEVLDAILKQTKRSVTKESDND